MLSNYNSFFHYSPYFAKRRHLLMNAYIGRETHTQRRLKKRNKQQQKQANKTKEQSNKHL